MRVLPIYVCKLCEIEGKKVEFNKRNDLREHIKAEHKAYVQRVLSNVSPVKLSKLQQRGVDPENWAAGYLIGVLGC